MKRVKSQALSLTLQPHLVQDNLPIEIIPKLYVGSIHAAFNQEAIIERGITHILNASGLPATFPRVFTYLTIDLRDKEAANILACIPATIIFIEAGLMEGSVLVHCAGGRSRSAALLTSYLMASRGWHFDYALSILKHARPVVQINKGFEQQLRAFGAHLCDAYAAHQAVVRQRLRSLVDRKLAFVSGVSYSSGGGGGVGIPASTPTSSTSDDSSSADEDRRGPRSRVPPTPGGRRRLAERRNSQKLLSLALPSSVDMMSSPSDMMLASTVTLGEDGSLPQHQPGGGPESLFPSDMADSALCRRGSLEGTHTPNGRSVNRSLHRRGKTTGTTGNTMALPPISPSVEAMASTFSPSSHISTAFADSGGGGSPMDVATSYFSSVPMPSPLALRSPFSSMSKLSFEHAGGGAGTPTSSTTGFARQTRLVHFDAATSTANLAEEASRMQVSQNGGGAITQQRRPSGGAATAAAGGRSLNSPVHPDAMSLLNARSRFQSAPALPHMTMPALKSAKHEMHPQLPPTPHLRLSRPTSTTVYVIPHLQAFEKSFACISCSTTLFSLGNVICLEYTDATSDASLIADPEGSTHVEDDDEDSSDANNVINSARARIGIRGGGGGGGSKQNFLGKANMGHSGGSIRSLGGVLAELPSPSLAQQQRRSSSLKGMDISTPPMEGGLITNIGDGSDLLGRRRSATPALSPSLDSSTGNTVTPRRLSNPNNVIFPSTINSGGAALLTPGSARNTAAGGSTSSSRFRFDHSASVCASTTGASVGPTSGATPTSSSTSTASTRVGIPRAINTAAQYHPSDSRGNNNDSGGNNNNNTSGTNSPLSHSLQHGHLKNDSEPPILSQISALSMNASGSIMMVGERDSAEGTRESTASSSLSCTPLSCPSVTSPPSMGEDHCMACDHSPVSASTQQQQHQCLSSSSSPTTCATPLYRPASSEQRRWLLGMRALEDNISSSSSSSIGSLGGGGDRSIKAVEKDVQACCRATTYKQKWIPVEWMPWMGNDILSEESGPIYCSNVHCRREIGRWDWSETLSGGDINVAMELPLIGIDREKVVFACSPTSAAAAGAAGGSHHSHQHGSSLSRRGSATLVSPRDNSNNNTGLGLLSSTNSGGLPATPRNLSSHATAIPHPSITTPRLQQSSMSSYPPPLASTSL